MSDDPKAPHFEPRTLADEVGNAALEGALVYAREKGVEVDHVFVTLCLKGVPEELDSSTCGHGFEDGKDLLVELLSSAQVLGKQLGIRLELVAPEMN